MTILLVSDSFRPILDGVALCVENYARELAAGGHRVAVAVPYTPDSERHDAEHPADGYTLMRYASFGLPGWRPYRVGVPRIHGVFQTLLRAWLAAGEPDVVHSHSPFVAGRLGRRVARATGARHISTFHSKYREDFMRSLPWKWAADRFAAAVAGFYRTVDAAWAPNDGSARTLASYGFDGPVTIVPNGSDLRPPTDDERRVLYEAGDRLIAQSAADGSQMAARARAADDAADAAAPLVMLFVGQHRWEKNPRLLLKGVARLARRLGADAARRIRLVFAGDGPDAGAMRRLAQHLGITAMTTFLGRVEDRTTLASLYARADLFLFPSRYDNAPLVLFEAAAHATPALVAADGTAAEIARDDQTAFLVGSDPADFADLLAELLEDRARIARVGAAAQRELYRGWEDVVGEAQRRYAEVIRSAGSQRE